MKHVEAIMKKFKVKIRSIESISQGSFSSEVYKISLEDQQNMILKIPYVREKLFRESKMLQRLAGSLPVPSVIDQWDGDEEVPAAMLLSYIEGEPCSEQGSTEQLSYQMGELLARLHEIPMPGCGHDTEHDFIHVDWWDFIRTKFNRIVASCEGYVSTDTLRQVTDYFDAVSMDLPPVDGPCAVHSDYRPGNILVKNNRITGIIDFESARGGSADFDFSKMNLYLWDKVPGAREVFEMGYQSIRPLPELDKLLNFNILFHAVNGIDFCVKRGVEVHKLFLVENIGVVERIVRNHG